MNNDSPFFPSIGISLAKMRVRMERFQAPDGKTKQPQKEKLEIEEQTKNVSIEPQHRVFFPTFSWDSITDPGAHVEMGSGNLYRIPKEALVRGSSPLIRKESLGASRLILISRDLFITTLEARMLCAENNVHPNF